jgi:4-hydroxybenzoate polyprenyltransferase
MDRTRPLPPVAAWVAIEGFSMLKRFRTLLEMIRFSHTLFALPFALLSAALAWKQKDEFSLMELIGILACMVFARSAAMAFNRLTDQEFDSLNPRTARRHLPAGQLSRASVWIFTLACSAGFIGSTFIFLFRDNPWPAIFSIPLLAFILVYSYCKRFTSLSHFWLGASLMLAPIAAWIAICGLSSLATPLLLGLAVLFWVAGFDILYACQDVEFDQQARLFSIPSRLGIRASLRVALFCHISMLAFLVALWVVSPFLGWIYLTGVVLVGALLGYEHWLVRPDDLTRVNQAFFQVNGVISVGLLAIVLLQLALSP